MDIDVAAVVVAIVGAVSASAAAMVKMFLDHIKEQRSEDRLLWGNHLSGSTAVMRDVAVNLQKVADKLDSMVIEFKGHDH